MIHIYASLYVVDVGWESVCVFGWEPVATICWQPPLGFMESSYSCGDSVSREDSGLSAPFGCRLVKPVGVFGELASPRANTSSNN